LFPSVMQQLRKAARLTQDQLAEILQVQKRTYGSWERGERQPDFETLCKIADYFNVTTDYLLGRTPMNIGVAKEPPPPPSEETYQIVIEPDEDPTPDLLEQKIMEVVAREFEKRGL